MLITRNPPQKCSRLMHFWQKKKEKWIKRRYNFHFKFRWTVFVFVIPNLNSWNIFKVIKSAEHGVNFSFGVLAAVSLPEIGHPSCKREQEYLYYYPNKTLNSFPSGTFSTAVALLCATPHLWPQQLWRSQTSATVWAMLYCWGMISASLNLLRLKSALT